MTRQEFGSATFGLLVAASSVAHAQERSARPTAKTKIETMHYRIVNTFPHDPTAFTQGLVFADGIFYESTGLNGESTLRKVEVTTGRVIQQVSVDRMYFAEGLALVGDELLQLTWTSRVGFVYDKKTLTRKRTFDYATEGWGIAFDGRRLVMSDGSSQLCWMDPKTLRVTKKITVRADGVPVERLNELEFVRGEIWANVWQTDLIAIIDPQTGAVRKWLDLRGLLPPERRGPQGDVLNGIAWDAKGDRLFVTGKKWPWLFEIAIA